MKKVFSFVAVSLALILSASLISCKAPSGGGGDSGSGGGSSGGGETPAGYKAGDVALEKIKIGNTEYDNTAQVYVTGKDGAEITGANPDFVEDAAADNYKGVFRTGRKVKLSPYIMSKYEVTQEIYTAVMTDQKVTVYDKEKILSATPFCCTSDNDDYNVLLAGEEQKYRAAEGITWFDAVYFCNALSEKTNLTKAYNITVTSVNSDGHIKSATVEPVANANGYRLPTEAEWEFAARGGNPAKPAWDYTFSGAAKADGSSCYDHANQGLDAVGWYDYNTASGTTSDGILSLLKGSAGYGTHHVGKKGYNGLGIYDMSGNVFEWCYDWYTANATSDDSEFTENGVVINPLGPSRSDNMGRVVRGGSWYQNAHISSVCYRNHCYDGNSSSHLGFRVCRSVK